MINIKRPSTPPADLKGTKAKPSSGETELEKVIEFYAKKGNVSKAFKFKAYKSKSVIEELGKLFSGKCAYCESKFQATQPVDVEHFRPKGGVMEFDRSPKRSTKKTGKKSSGKSSASTEPKLKLRTPGYYWLAASWDNLLPSCIDCNRERNQKVPDETDPTGFKTIKLGKANHFPLDDEARRRVSHKSKKREEPLILDPALDQPEKHLEFTKDGIVRPTLVRKKPSPKGEASIKVYGLQRFGLVQERRARAKMVLAQMERVQELMKDFDRRPSDKQLEERLNRELEELKRYTKPEEEYAGMSRQIVRKFLASL